MKTSQWIYVICASFLMIAGMSACNDDSEEVLKNQVYEFKTGDIIKHELYRGDELIYQVESEVTNYGTEDAPIHFAITKSFKFGNDSFKGTTFLVERDDFEDFIIAWAKSMDMSILNKIDEIAVCMDIYRYFHSTDADMGFFIHLLKKRYEVADLKYAIDMASKRNVPIAVMMTALDSEEVVDSRGTLTDLKSIIEGVVDLYNVWHDFSTNNPPIAEAVEDICSFISADDEKIDNYIKVKDFSSGEYKLSYDTGSWEAKFNYVIEGFTGTHPTIPGYFIPRSRIRTTKLSVKGPSFIGSGEYSYSSLINISDTFDYPVVQANGQIHVVYGDCCCFRFHSYLNFSLDGRNGYKQMTWNDGR